MNKPTDHPALQGSPQQTEAAPKAHATRLAVAGGLLLAAAVALAAWPLLGTGAETTEDAYVDGNVVQVTPQVGGTVTAITADSTDYVQAGQPLVRLNRVDGELALARAEAQLSQAVRQVRAKFANAGQMQANVALRRTALVKAEADLARRKSLAASGAISGEDIRHAEDAVKSERAALAAVSEQLSSSRALIDGTTVATHPDVLNAVAQVRSAYVALARTTLPAPVSGIVTRRNVQVGQRVGPGAPLMAIVPLDDVWVDANFKESQLHDIRIGQKVVMTSDVYGSAVRYSGRIVGQDAGTGSAFSLMPAQNATGNWIKVMQRVPVRIALDAGQLAAHPLKLGLSMKVSVDVSDRHGPMVASVSSPRQSYRTDVYAGEMQQADQLVQRIIRASSGKPPAAG